MRDLKRFGGGVLWLLLAAVCFFAPIHALVRLIATGDLPMITSRHGTAGPVAEAFSRGYFASLGFHVLAGFLGLAFVRVGLVDSFGMAMRRVPRTFARLLLLAVPALFFVLPVVISIWWQQARP